MDRVTSGVKGFDELVGGGYPKGAVILVSGSPGTGKTIFSLQFLKAGLEKGERCVYITYSQMEKDIIDQASTFGWDLGKLQFIEPNAEEFVELLAGKTYQRLVVDSLSNVAMMTRETLGKFIKQTKKTSCTTLLISELPKNTDWLSRDTISEFLADGVVLLRSVEVAGEVKNLIKVEKMRSTKIEKAPHAYNITDRGFELKLYKVS
jgi:circadian clock protein KaiC